MCNFRMKKNPCSKMLHQRKILTTEVGGDKKFIKLKVGSEIISTTFWKNRFSATWLQYSQGKNSYLGHSVKNMFKVLGEIG